MTDLERANTEPRRQVYETDLLYSACPPNADDLADAYVMRHIPEYEAVPYELHFILCAPCAERVEIALNFIESLRASPISTWR